MSFDNPAFWVAAWQIVVIDLLLSGDNAVVIALACRGLPEHQRRVAVFWGVFGAVAARVVLTIFAAVLLQLAWVKLVGAVLLAWIGMQLINDGGAPDEPEHAALAVTTPPTGARNPMMKAIYTVVTADIIMSLDNVVGIAAASHGNVGLLVFGLLLSIPIVMFGSGAVMRLLWRFPILIVAGGGLLGYIAGEMWTTDPVVVQWIERHLWVQLLSPYAGFALVVATGLALRARGRPRAGA